MAEWRVSGADNLVRALTVALVRSRFPEDELEVDDAADPSVRISPEGRGAWFAVVDDAAGRAAQAELAAGATAVITLASSSDEISDAFAAVEQDRSSPVGGTQARAHGKEAKELGGVSLTPRESEVVELVVRGCSNREIASELGISVHTVRSYLQTVTMKFGVSSRHRLAQRAVGQ